ncbi:MAG: hypothetical protein ORN58_06740, partial [Sediminibacterium sp.]|nr:hypothetical protein [Sediminibacterium sp.]
FNTNTYKIGIYGVEESKVHWRVLSSNDNAVWNKPIGTTDDLTLQNQMEGYQRQAAGFANDLNTASIIMTVAAAGLTALGFFQPWAWQVAGVLFAEAAIAIHAANNLWEISDEISNSETRWNQLIGAADSYQDWRLFPQLTEAAYNSMNEVLELYNSTCGMQLGKEEILKGILEVNVRSNPGGGRPGDGSCNYASYVAAVNAILADPSSYIDIPILCTIPVNNESDGLFGTATQRIPYDYNEGPENKVINIRAEGVNHAEFYNHPEMTKIYTSILFGEQVGEGRYGKINQRIPNFFDVRIQNPSRP